MRVDPEAVYLEVQTGATVYSSETHATRYADAVTLHFKDSNKWQRRSFIAKDDENLEHVLGTLGAWFDTHGLQGALDQAMGREPEKAAAE